MGFKFKDNAVEIQAVPEGTRLTTDANQPVVFNPTNTVAGEDNFIVRTEDPEPTEFFITAETLARYFDNTDGEQLPVPVVTMTPPSPTSVKRPVFSWIALAGAVGYYYRVDAGAWVFTTELSFQPETDLSIAAHTFEIKGRDGFEFDGLVTLKNFEITAVP